MPFKPNQTPTIPTFRHCDCYSNFINSCWRKFQLRFFNFAMCTYLHAHNSFIYMRRIATSLHSLVTVIIKLCTQEKVFRFNAISYVAFMANKQTNWDWPVSFNPSKPMRANLLAVISSIPITIFTYCFSPQYTFIHQYNYSILD